MRYLSTRGDAASSTQSFCDILLGGLAPDGGLYLPETYPQVSRAELDAWRQLSYAELAFAVLSKFIDDIPPADLKATSPKDMGGEKNRGLPEKDCFSRCCGKGWPRAKAGWRSGRTRARCS